MALQQINLDIELVIVIRKFEALALANKDFVIEHVERSYVTLPWTDMNMTFSHGFPEHISHSISAPSCLFDLSQQCHPLSSTSSF